MADLPSRNRNRTQNNRTVINISISIICLYIFRCNASWLACLYLIFSQLIYIFTIFLIVNAARRRSSSPRGASDKNLPSYRNHFNEKLKGIEGTIINVILKPAVSKLMRTMQELLQPENMVNFIHCITIKIPSYIINKALDFWFHLLHYLLGQKFILRSHP